jgi:CRISPR-associated protein Cmr3
MSTFSISPRDPLIARDGKPFSSDPGARATSLPFPLPSTVVGAIRSLVVSNDGVFPETTADGAFNYPVRLKLEGQSPEITSPQQLLEHVCLRGPLLSDQHTVYAPLPADAFKHSGQTFRMRPIKTLAGELSNLDARLLLVALNSSKRTGKPESLERYWTWTQFKRWLLCGAIDPSEALGINGATPEVRTHVSINPETQTALDGALFQTGGLEFTQHSPQKLSDASPLALLVDTNARLQPMLTPFGGERRLSRWDHSNQALPGCPSGLLEQLQQDRACRLLLLTPGLFANGVLPAHTTPSDPGVDGYDWTHLSDIVPGIHVRLRAVACNRYQVISGWDAAHQRPDPDRPGRTIRGQPKKTRRLATAGTVYHINLDAEPGEPGNTAIATWLEKIWMHNISDDPQDRRDGFGLVAVGVWNANGTPEEPKVKS